MASMNPQGRFATKSVLLGDVMMELLEYLSTALPRITAWLAAVPLEGGQAFRIVGGGGVHSPVLLTVEPMTKGSLGQTLRTGDVVTPESGEIQGSWYEADLGPDRISVPVLYEGETIAAIAGYGPPGTVGMDEEWAIRHACADAAPYVSVGLRVSQVESELEATRRMLDAVGLFVDAADKDALVAQVLQEAVALCSADSGSVMLFDKEKDGLLIAASTHLPEEIVKSTVVRLGEGISGFVAQAGHGTVINDADDKPRGGQRLHPVHSAVCVPMVTPDGALYGVVNVGSPVSGTFSDVEVGRLSMLAAHAAKALVRMTDGAPAGDPG